MKNRWSEHEYAIHLANKSAQPVVKLPKISLDTLLIHLRMAHLPDPVTEHRFHPTRKWRFDYAYIDEKIAVEREGGIWTQGRHTRGAGYENDLRKYNEAVLLGWRVLRFSTEMIENGEAVTIIRQLLHPKEVDDVRRGLQQESK